MAQTLSDSDGGAIVVTAQRRPELADEVPISLTAKSGEVLERMQSTEMATLGKVVPSLVVMRTGAFTQPYLRGIGKRSTLGAENSVATYVDGVYLASSMSALLDLHGIERIEVLNGPQGTLFGRNATAGVIQVVTRDPSPTSSGEATLRVGTHGYLRSDLYLSGGNDRLAANLAVSLSSSGGYGTNLFTGRTDQNEVDHSLVARSKWVWQPDPALKLTFAGDYQDLQQDFSSVPMIGFTPIGQPRVQTFRDRDQDAPSGFRFRYGGGSMRADLDAGGIALMSLTALRAMRERHAMDLDLGPLPLFSGVPSARQGQFSQEFQLQSASTSAVLWVAGLYYIRVEEQYDPLAFSYGGSYSARLGGLTGQTLYAQGTASSYAGYGQAVLPIAKATHLTLGARYTVEDRTVRANGERTYATPPLMRPLPGLPLTADPPFRNRRRFSEPTWRASLDSRFSDRWMWYVSASRGFQSGGWNLQTPQNPAFEPERLDDFEAGIKFADHGQRVRADAGVFFYDYSDMQVSAITQLGNATINAASAVAYGFELQLDARPDDRTDLALGLAWQTTRFRGFPNASCVDYGAGAAAPYAPRACDVTGNSLPFAPDLKVNLGASREVPLGDTGVLQFSGNLAYNSGYFSEPDNVVRQDAYATIDASVEWRPDHGGLALRLWVLNLTDAHYVNALVTFATAGVLQTPAAPTQIGASITYHW